MDKTIKYLPVCLNLYNKKVVIFGGGKIAYDKAKILHRYGAKITCIANKFDRKLYKLSDIKLIKKTIKYSDMKKNYSFVVCALNDNLLNKKIYKHYSTKNIPINVVDQPKLCNAIFPAILENNGITFAISTNGKMPGFSRYLKQCLKKWIPPNTSKIMKELSKIRNILKQKIQNHKTRMKIIRRVLKKHNFLDDKNKNKSFIEIKTLIKKAFTRYL